MCLSWLIPRSLTRTIHSIIISSRSISCINWLIITLITTCIWCNICSRSINRSLICSRINRIIRNWTVRSISSSLHITIPLTCLSVITWTCSLTDTSLTYASVITWTCSLTDTSLTYTSVVTRGCTCTHSHAHSWSTRTFHISWACRRVSSLSTGRKTRNR